MSNYTGFGNYGYNGCIDPAFDTCVAQPGGPVSPPYVSTPPLATPAVRADRVTSVGVNLSWVASPGVAARHTWQVACGSPPCDSARQQR